MAGLVVPQRKMGKNLELLQREKSWKYTRERGGKNLEAPQKERRKKNAGTIEKDEGKTWSAPRER